MNEQGFLIPRKVRTDWEFLGMTKRRMGLVAPWVAAGVAIYYLGDALPMWLHMGAPAVLIGVGFLGFGWAEGEDDRTAWELLQRWWRHYSRQQIFLYRKERITWQRTRSGPTEPQAALKASSVSSPPASASISLARSEP